MNNHELEIIISKIRYLLLEIAPSFLERKVDSDTDLFEIGVLDSFSLLELVAKIETEFDQPFPFQDVDFTTFTSIFEISKFIHANSLKPFPLD